MAWFQRKREATPSAPALVVSELNVFYGRAHALQNISLTLDRGVLAVVGRNGMGKTSLCNAITGLIPALGSIRVYGQEIRGLTPNKITDLGIGYVPQGRRVWPSLSVHEHLNLAAKSARSGEWTVDRIYQTFPRLAERKGNGGAQLSGGEQQMLAIGRALLFNPSLLVMDEPTEGLAPVIVEQVAGMLRDIAASGEISILLIEQNLGVAIDVADNVAVMMNGQIARMLPARELAADKDLRTRLLGIRQSEDETLAPNMDPDAQIEAADEAENSVRVFRVRRAESPDQSPSLDDANTAVAGFNRWNSAAAEVRRKDISRRYAP
jgi:ABC-type branched-subunit amino acid transport system ATPase component